MRTTILGLAVICSIAALTAQQDYEPTCRNCPATYVPNDEIQGYVKKAIAEKLTDQQVRDVDIGKSHVAIGVVHRGKLAAPAPDSVAEHDFVSSSRVPTSWARNAVPRTSKQCACSTVLATMPPRCAMASPTS